MWVALGRKKCQVVEEFLATMGIDALRGCKFPQGAGDLYVQQVRHYPRLVVLGRFVAEWRSPCGIDQQIDDN